MLIHPSLPGALPPAPLTFFARAKKVSKENRPQRLGRYRGSPPLVGRCGDGRNSLRSDSRPSSPAAPSPPSGCGVRGRSKPPETLICSCGDFVPVWFPLCRAEWGWARRDQDGRVFERSEFAPGPRCAQTRSGSRRPRRSGVPFLCVLSLGMQRKDVGGWGQSPRQFASLPQITGARGKALAIGKRELPPLTKDSPQFSDRFPPQLYKTAGFSSE